MVRGVGLLSGGLDSILAIKVCQEQGIHMTGISFETPFFDAQKARTAAEGMALDLLVMDITTEHLRIVKNPQYGYGKNMNPCIDCHALMVRVAGRIMEEKGWDFIATGEVVGQRPMSQGSNSLNAVAKESGYRDFLLRPLSAKLLNPTEPERNGKVQRGSLLGISGRGRKPQLALAQQYGIKEYATPAGGCLLTEVSYCRRLRDLLGGDGCTTAEIRLLRYGRHIRLNEKTKIIVGRNQSENEAICSLSYEKHAVLRASYIPSPTVVLPLHSSAAEVLLAAGICLAYSGAPKDRESEITFIESGETKTLMAAPVEKKTFSSLILA